MSNARKKQEQLTVACSDRDAEEILAEAIDRVPGFHVPVDIPAADRRLPVGLASLAIGDRDFSHALIARLANEAYLLLSARYFLWSGTAGALRAELPRIDETLAQCEPFAELHELAIALESIGATAEAAAVRVRAAAAKRRILPDWEAEDCNVLPAGNPADTVNIFMHTMLGAAPDAARGRLRLRPCWPDWLEWITVRNIRLGDALITLEYQRDHSAAQYKIEQVAGAMPVRLIFEPAFAHQIAGIQVDDVPADLNLQMSAARVIAPVQLMLDHERVLRFQRQ